MNNSVCADKRPFLIRSRPYKNGPSFDTIKGMIPKLKAIGVSEIILSGGEPLTRTDIFDIVEFKLHTVVISHKSLSSDESLDLKQHMLSLL